MKILSGGAFSVIKGDQFSIGRKGRFIARKVAHLLRRSALHGNLQHGPLALVQGFVDNRFAVGGTCRVLVVVAKRDLLWKSAVQVHAEKIHTLTKFQNRKDQVVATNRRFEAWHRAG